MRIFDARVLRGRFISRGIEYHDAEVNHLSSVLEPITNREPADLAIVDRAFDFLRTSERLAGQNIAVQIVHSSFTDTKMKFIERIISTGKDDAPFEEWIVEFERDLPNGQSTSESEND